MARTKSAFTKPTLVKIAKPASARTKTANLTKHEVDFLLEERERLMTELRKLNADSTVVANAQQLLTRWWSRSSWSARAELLRNVEWLVRVEQHRDRREPPSR